MASFICGMTVRWILFGSSERRGSGTFADGFYRLQISFSSLVAGETVILKTD